MSIPFDLATLVTHALEAIVRATAACGDLTEAEIATKAKACAALIVSCRPRNVTELTLAAQTFMLSEVFFQRARLAMADGPSGQRDMASFAKIGRIMHGHIDRLTQSGVGSHRGSAEAANEEAWRAVAAHAVSQVLARRQPAQPAAVPFPAAAPEPEQTMGGMPDGAPVAATSWLDPPFEQWLIDVLGRRPARPGNVVTIQSRNRADPVPALPRRPAGYKRIEDGD